MKTKTFDSKFSQDLISDEFAKNLYAIDEREIYIQK